MKSRKAQLQRSRLLCPVIGERAGFVAAGHGQDTHYFVEPGEMVQTHFPGAGPKNRSTAAPRGGYGVLTPLWACVAGLVLLALAVDVRAEPRKSKKGKTTATKRKAEKKPAKTSTPKEEEGPDLGLPPSKEEGPDLGLPPGGEEAQEREEKTDGGKVLERPLDPSADPALVTADVPPDYAFKREPPLGFTGRSSVIPTVDPSVDFVPVEDRWRLGWPEYDRYDRGHAIPDDYPYEQGSICDPYQQNVLKGDYPIAGQHVFLNILAQSFQLFDGRQTPVGTGAFESTARPFEEDFFESPNQFFYTHFFRFTFDVNHGDAGFKQADWRVHLTPIFNVNSLNVDELAFVNPNVLKGTARNRSYLALEEYFVESKLADLSPEYDTVSMRLGSQFFTSDFRGFLFSDTNRAVRLFGSRNGNREQYNLLYFRPAEKDSNSALNTMDDRAQNLLIANYYIQDFIWPGYQVSASIHYDNDHPSRRFDTNSFRIRPDNAGVFQPHNIDSCYIGLASDGHIERYNLTTQLYYVFGRDSMNPIANTGQDISAAMAAVELSYDRDWVRFRTSFFWSSGDNNPNNSHACAFDTIFDNPNFAGGEFSYWQRQGIGLFAVNLTNRESLIPDLRSSKIQGQANYVNPGLLLFNLGLDFDITPRLKTIFNTNFLWFESTKVLETFLFDGNIAHRIGTDISLGLEYRPLASNNIQLTLGISTLIPGDGFEALYDKRTSSVDPQVASFFQTILQY